MRKIRTYNSPVEYLERGAHPEGQGEYRYYLTRTWDRKLPKVAFIGLNPSTASHEQDDATIIKCVNYSRRWKMGGMVMLNIFAFRSTYPADLIKPGKSAVGDENDATLLNWVSKVDLTVACWGNHGELMGRAAIVRKNLAGKLRALQISKRGHPKHPLYLPAEIEIENLVKIAHEK